MSEIFVENFEIESRMIEFGIKNSITINDLSDAEKYEVFGNSKTIELNFEIETPIEIYR